MYAIEDPDGNAHMDEMCVCTDTDPFGDSIDYLKEECDVGAPKYQVVPVFRFPTVPAPDDIEQKSSWQR